MNKIIYVDFQNKQIISEAHHKCQQSMIADPVLAQVASQLPADQFVIYKKTIDDWMRRNFEYQMDHEDGKLYTEPEK